MLELTNVQTDEQMKGKLGSYMSHVTSKPVFGVFNQVRLKRVCAATEAR